MFVFDISRYDFLVIMAALMYGYFITKRKN